MKLNKFPLKIMPSIQVLRITCTFTEYNIVVNVIIENVWWAACYSQFAILNEINGSIQHLHSIQTSLSLYFILYYYIYVFCQKKFTSEIGNNATDEEIIKEWKKATPIYKT